MAANSSDVTVGFRMCPSGPALAKGVGKFCSLLAREEKHASRPEQESSPRAFGQPPGRWRPQDDVKQHAIEMLDFTTSDRLCAAGHGHAFVPSRLQESSEQVPGSLIVINDKDFAVNGFSVGFTARSRLNLCAGYPPSRTAGRSVPALVISRSRRALVPCRSSPARSRCFAAAVVTRALGACAQPFASAGLGRGPVPAERWARAESGPAWWRATGLRAAGLIGSVMTMSVSGFLRLKNEMSPLGSRRPISLRDVADLVRRIASARSRRGCCCA